MDNVTANIAEIDWRSMSAEETETLLMARIARYEQAIAARGGRRPKREGCIVERIALMRTLREADTLAQKGKKKRKIVKHGKVIHIPNRHIRRHNLRAEQDLRDLQLMILTLTFPPLEFTTAKVKTDAGKEREIVKQNFYPWRILQHAIMLVVSPKVHGSLVPEAFSCIKGKGLHYGVKLLKRGLKLHPGWKWMWKTDFKKFYQSIPHQLIEAEFSRMFKDKRFIELLHIVLFSYESDQQLIDTLQNERTRTERFAHWCCDKPNDRKFGRNKARPPDEAQRQTRGLSTLL
jgi:hypothetical protein